MRRNKRQVGSWGRRWLAGVLALGLVAAACGDDGDDDAATDTGEPTTTAAQDTSASDEEVVLLVPHEVEDYGAWEPYFLDHRDVREEYGGSRDLVYRDVDNPDNVTVYMTYPSVEEAEAFFVDPSLGEAMEQAGVLPPLPPEHSILREVEVVDYQNPGSATAGDEADGVTLFIRHEVEDYDAWKPVFDEHQEVREQYGGTGHRLYTPIDDPNDTVVYMTFPSAADAEAFVADPSLAEAMERAGVLPPVPPPYTLRTLELSEEY